LWKNFYDPCYLHLLNLGTMFYDEHHIFVCPDIYLKNPVKTYLEVLNVYISKEKYIF
jgi:hypothetical protein